VDVRQRRWNVTEKYFISVPDKFGKSARDADLPINPTAASLLAASSAPCKTEQTTVEFGAARQQITTEVARKTLAETRKKRPRRAKKFPADKLGDRLVKLLERYRERWNQKELGRSSASANGLCQEQ
jgi:hypothetical protein